MLTQNSKKTLPASFSLMRKGRIVIIKKGRSIIIDINNSVKCLVKLIVITTPLRKGVECRI